MENGESTTLTDDQKYQLITLVQGFPELWNLRSDCYRTTKLKEKNFKWQLIANHLKTTMKVAKAVFHHLHFLTDTMTGRAMFGPLNSVSEPIQTPASVPVAVSAIASNSANSSASTGGNMTVISNTNPSSLGLGDLYMEEVILPEDEEDFSMFDSQTKRTPSSADSGMGTPLPKRKTAIQRALDIEERKIQVYQDEKNKKVLR